jgi:hypothetical protein
MLICNLCNLQKLHHRGIIASAYPEVPKGLSVVPLHIPSRYICEGISDSTDVYQHYYHKYVILKNL